MKVEIQRRFTFEAAHHLEWHQGKCHRVHGHSFVMDVTVSGSIPMYGDAMPSDINAPREDDVHFASDFGMVVDFAVLDAVVKQRIVDRLDHRNLDDFGRPGSTPYLPYPTVEMLALLVFTDLHEAFRRERFRLERVQVWETAKGSAIVTRDEYDR